MLGILQWVAHIVGIAVGIFIGRRLLSNGARSMANGETRTHYVVCPRCGRRRHQRYGVGGGYKPREDDEG